MTEERTVYFLVPLYNEAENIALLHQNIMAACPSYKKFFLLVDDGSSDNTVNAATRLFGSAQNFHLLTKNKNQGPGDSFNAGFEWILSHSKQHDKDLVVTLEGDNTSDLGILDAMMMLSVSGYSLVLASVYAQGGGFEGTTFWRKLISFVANQMLRFAFDIKVLTLSSFFRIYHVNLLARIKQRHSTLIESKGFICMIEILLKAIRADAKIIEVPMTLKSNVRKGKSKMKIMKTAWSYIKFLVANLKKY
jgi:dolichol-phosphate mannosyltransferase